MILVHKHQDKQLGSFVQFSKIIFSQLDKVVRNTVRIGKDKSSKAKDVKAATWSSRLPSSGDSDPSNGTQYGFDPSPQDNIKNLSDKEVLERFEQLLVCILKFEMHNTFTLQLYCLKRVIELFSPPQILNLIVSSIDY